MVFFKNNISNNSFSDNIFSNKRAQGSTEYLSTFLWTGLALVVVVGALVSFGVFNSSNYSKESCESGEQISCKDALLYESGDISVTFTNLLSRAVTITDFNFPEKDLFFDKYYLLDLQNSLYLDPGKSTTLSVPLEGSSFAEGNKESLSYEIYYVISSDSTNRKHVVSGSAVVEVFKDVVSETGVYDDCTNGKSHVVCSDDGHSDFCASSNYLESVCCDAGDCTYDGVCYGQSQIFSSASMVGLELICDGGVWFPLDNSNGDNLNCGFCSNAEDNCDLDMVSCSDAVTVCHSDILWLETPYFDNLDVASPNCCGDDSNEFVSRLTLADSPTLLFFKDEEPIDHIACCAEENDCVLNHNCYSIGESTSFNSVPINCSSNGWLSGFNDDLGDVVNDTGYDDPVWVGSGNGFAG